MTLRRRCAYAIYILIIIVGTIPGAREEVGFVAPGLILHFGTYAFIAVLLFTGTPGTPFSRALKAILVVAAMGAGDEFVQSFVPYRHAAVEDWCTDVAAAICTATLLAHLLRNGRQTWKDAAPTAEGDRS